MYLVCPPIRVGRPNFYHFCEYQLLNLYSVKHYIITTFLFAFVSSQTFGQLFVRSGATGDGSSWQSALGDLQQALAIAKQKPGTEIWVAAGEYTPSAAGDRDASFDVPDGTKLFGGFVGHESNIQQRDWQKNLTLLSGDIGARSVQNDNSYTIIYTRHVSSATVVDGFVVTGGAANGAGVKGNLRRSGGGWYNDGSNGYSNPSIRNCLFVNNYGRDGGALYNMATNGVTNPLINNCQFVNNHADIDGGAIFNNGSYGICSPNITHCLFEENEASYGAGIHNMAENGESHPRIAQCAFINNLAYTRGSSVYNNREYEGQCEASIDYPSCKFLENKDKVGSTVSSTVNNSMVPRRNTSEIVFKNGM